MAFNPDLMHARMAFNRAVMMTGEIDPDAVVQEQLGATLTHVLQTGARERDGFSALHREAMQRVTDVATMHNEMNPLAEAKDLWDRLAEAIPVGEERIRKQQEAIGLGKQEVATCRGRIAELNREAAELQHVAELQRKALHPVATQAYACGDKITQYCGALGDSR